MFKVTKTAGDIVTDIQRTFGDEAGVQVTNSDIFRFINAAQIEITQKNDVLKASGTTSTVVGQYEYDLDATMDINKIQSIQYNGIKLQHKSWNEAEEYLLNEDPNRVASGTPEFWFDWGNLIQLFPKPDAVGTLKIYFSPLPTVVDNVADSLSLPDNYYNRIFDYVMARAYELDENFQGHQAKMGQFSDELLNMSLQDSTQNNDKYQTIYVRPEDM